MQRMDISEGFASEGRGATDIVNQHIAVGALNELRTRAFGLERNEFDVFVSGPWTKKTFDTGTSKGHGVDNDDSLSQQY
jgi:hypothetical protein